MSGNTGMVASTSLVLLSSSSSIFADNVAKNMSKYTEEVDDRVMHVAKAILWLADVNFQAVWSHFFRPFLSERRRTVVRRREIV